MQDSTNAYIVYNMRFSEEVIKMKKILIAVDGSKYSDKAVAEGVKIANAFGSKVVIVNVIHMMLPEGMHGHSAVQVDYSKIYDENIYQTAKEKSLEILDAAKKKFGELSANVETFTLQGDVAKSIIEYVSKSDFDLVVLGSHGSGSVVGRLLMGSVTTKVLHHIDKPILVVK